MVDAPVVPSAMSRSNPRRETVCKDEIDTGMTVTLDVSKPVGYKSKTFDDAEITDATRIAGDLLDFVAVTDDYRVKVTFPGANAEIFHDGERTAMWKLTDVTREPVPFADVQTTGGNHKVVVSVDESTDLRKGTVYTLETADGWKYRFNRFSAGEELRSLDDERPDGSARQNASGYPQNVEAIRDELGIDRSGPDPTLDAPSRSARDAGYPTVDAEHPVPPKTDAAAVKTVDPADRLSPLEILEQQNGSPDKSDTERARQKRRARVTKKATRERRRDSQIARAFRKLDSLESADEPAEPELVTDGGVDTDESDDFDTFDNAISTDPKTLELPYGQRSALASFLARRLAGYLDDKTDGPFYRDRDRQRYVRFARIYRQLCRHSNAQAPIRWYLEEGQTQPH